MEKEKEKKIMRWHLKTCSAFSAEECKHVVLLTFIIDFRKPGRLLRKWFPSLGFSAVPIIDSVGRYLIIFKSCFAVPDVKLLARARTQLSSRSARELQQRWSTAVPPPAPTSTRRERGAAVSLQPRRCFLRGLLNDKHHADLEMFFFPPTFCLIFEPRSALFLPLRALATSPQHPAARCLVSTRSHLEAQTWGHHSQDFLSGSPITFTVPIP